MCVQEELDVGELQNGTEKGVCGAASKASLLRKLRKADAVLPFIVIVGIAMVPRCRSGINKGAREWMGVADCAHMKSPGLTSCSASLIATLDFLE